MQNRILNKHIDLKTSTQTMEAIMKNIIIVLICIMIATLSGCISADIFDPAQIIDEGMKEYDFDSSLVNQNSSSNAGFVMNRTYESVEEMYIDSDYVVIGVIEDIRYFYKEGTYKIEESLIVNVNKSYKGDIGKNSTIMVLGNKSYWSQILYQEMVDIYLEETKTTPPASWERITEEGLRNISSSDTLSLSIGDECMLFLTYGFEDTFAGKKVFASDNIRSYVLDEDVPKYYWSPSGSYVSMGYGMGTFIKDGGNYVRRDYYRVNFDSPEYMDTLDKIESEFDVKELTNMVESLSKSDDNQMVSPKATIDPAYFYTPEPTTDIKPTTRIYAYSPYDDLEYLRNVSNLIVKGTVISSKKYTDAVTGLVFEDIELKIDVISRGKHKVNDVIHVLDTSRHERITMFNQIYNEGEDVPSVDVLPFEQRFYKDDVCLLFLADADNNTLEQKKIINIEGALDTIEVLRTYEIPAGYYVPYADDMGIFILRDTEYEQLQYNIAQLIDEPEKLFLQENTQSFLKKNIEYYARLLD